MPHNFDLNWLRIGGENSRRGRRGEPMASAGKPEQFKSAEEEPVSTFSIKFRLRRHGPKNGPNESTQQEDLVMLLTEKGRVQAHEVGLTLDGMEGAKPVGSMRARTGDTAAQLAYADVLTGEEKFASYDDILAKLDELNKSHPQREKRLDMPNKDTHPEFPAAMKAHAEGKYMEGLLGLYEAAKARGEGHTSMYAEQARNIASYIEHLALASQRGARKVAESFRKKKTDGVENTVVKGEGKRIPVSHAGVTESFLAEVIREMRGEDERKKFFDAAPNGFDVLRGIDIDFLGTSKKGAEPKIHLTFEVGKDDKKYAFDQDVPFAIIQKIRKELSAPETIYSSDSRVQKLAERVVTAVREAAETGEQPDFAGFSVEKMRKDVEALKPDSKNKELRFRPGSRLRTYTGERDETGKLKDETFGGEAVIKDETTIYRNVEPLRYPKDYRKRGLRGKLIRGSFKKDGTFIEKQNGAEILFNEYATDTVGHSMKKYGIEPKPGEWITGTSKIPSYLVPIPENIGDVEVNAANGKKIAVNGGDFIVVDDFGAGKTDVQAIERATKQRTYRSWTGPTVADLQKGF
jgi:broad specificity phosphatase PhoE